MSLEESMSPGNSADWEVTGFKGYKKDSSGKYVAEMEGAGGESVTRELSGLVNEISSLKKDFENGVWVESDKEALQQKVQEMEKIISEWPED